MTMSSRANRIMALSQPLHTLQSTKASRCTATPHTQHIGSWQLLLDACNQFTTILMTIGTIDYWFLMRSIWCFCIERFVLLLQFVRAHSNSSVTFNFIGVNQCGLCHNCACERPYAAYLITRSKCRKKKHHELEFHRIHVDDGWIFCFLLLLICSNQGTKSFTSKRNPRHSANWNVCNWYIGVKRKPKSKPIDCPLAWSITNTHCAATINDADHFNGLWVNTHKLRFDIVFPIIYFAALRILICWAVMNRENQRQNKKQTLSASATQSACRQ